jgi:hypothetical protein
MPTPVLERPSAVQPAISPWVWAFRCLRWSTYLAALVTLALLLHKSRPPVIQVSTQAEDRAEQKVDQVQHSASRGEPATLRLDESELNSYLASHLNLQNKPVAPPTNVTAKPDDAPAPAYPVPSNDTLSPADIEQAKSSVKDVKVQMEGDQVHAYVVFDVHGKDMTLDLVGRLGSADGFLRFEPVSGKLGSLPIPQSTLETAVQRLMESPENREKLRLPSDIRELHIENGELVATYN